MRMQRLRDLVERLESLPASPDRDRILSEVRSRAVDLDTGVTPRAMLPVREPIPPPREQPVRVASPKRPHPPAPVPTPATSLAALVWPDQVLSLDDPPAPSGADAIPAWRLGLRG
jgi:hypothetical protein